MMSFFLTIESDQNFGRIEDMAASWATARRTFRPRIIEALIQAVVLRGNAGFFGSLAPPKTALSYSQGGNIDLIDNQLTIIDYTLCPETLSLPPRKNDASRYFSVSSKRGRWSFHGHAKISLLELLELLLLSLVYLPKRTISLSSPRTARPGIQSFCSLLFDAVARRPELAGLANDHRCLSQFAFLLSSTPTI